MDLGKLGTRIKHLRERRRLRQADVAAALRISAQPQQIATDHEYLRARRLGGVLFTETCAAEA